MESGSRKKMDAHSTVQRELNFAVFQLAIVTVVKSFVTVKHVRGKKKKKLLAFSEQRNKTHGRPRSPGRG